MRSNDYETRLDGFWGRVDRKHIELIDEHVVGSMALDIGCGLGSTTAYVTDRSTATCVGVDYDLSVLRVARRRYSGKRYLNVNCESLAFSDGTFDTVILRDALHHLYNESDFDRVTAEIQRVSKERSRIIILDPNINTMVRVGRRIIGHRDEETSVGIARDVLAKMNYRIVHSGFNTVISLPLSGGYVGVPLLPNIPVVVGAVLICEGFLERVINGLGLGASLCWRYLIVADHEG